MKRFILPLFLLFSAHAAMSSPAYPALLSPSAAGFEARAWNFSGRGYYQAAADQLRRLETERIPLSSDEEQSLLFMLGNASAENGDARCLELLERFTRLYPASPLSSKAEMARADYLFFSRRYSQALEAYKKIDLSRLEPDVRPRATYRRAFCLARCGFFPEAARLFATLSGNKEYAMPALYCEAYTDYMREDYTAAYRKFSRVASAKSSSPRAANLAPLCPDCYLAQIDYLNGDYRAAADRAAEALAAGPGDELTVPTLRVEGLSLFKLGDPSAVDPLQKYVDAAGEASAPDAVYALGTIRYGEGNLDEAAALFARVTDDRNAEAQGALFGLGQIAAIAGDDNAAAIYFERAARIPFDHTVSRQALYNYAAARTRGGKTPFAPQIDLLEEFLAQYPDSEHAPSVREYLASAYFHEKDYARALQSIERIPNPSRAVLASRQKILYRLGMQEVQNARYAEASSHLRQAVELGNLNAGLLPQAWLWLGDALYARSQYSAADQAYTKAIATGLKGENRSLAVYGRGYSMLQQNKWRAAAELFRAAAADASLPERLRADARLRLADCVFYAGDNALARRLYAEARDAGAEAGYAAWRHATLTGVMGDTKGKIRELEALASGGESRWMPEILADLSEAYAASGNEGKASSTLRRLLSRYPRAESAPRASMSLAETYMRSGRQDKAVEQLRTVISTWPASQQALSANNELRRIYAEKGQLAEYAEFLRSSGAPFTLSRDDMESLAFDAAADAFNANERDIEKAEAYLRDFPTSSRIAEATSMVARGREAAGNAKGALLAWRQLAATGDPEYYTEAAAGIMRNSDDPAERLKYARRLSSASGVSADTRQEARFIEAEALSASGNKSEAEIIWKELAATPATLSGARSAVALGELYLARGKTLMAEQTLTSFIDSGTPHSYWLARAYIVLADAYKADGKKHLAKEYLESLRDNYPGNEPDIRQMVSNRLSRL